MWWRVLLAAVLGGAVMFAAGATEHMVFQLVDRTFEKLPGEGDDRARDFVNKERLLPGMYPFPDFVADLENKDLTADARKRKADLYAERFKEGPSGWIIVGPTNQDPMGPRILIMEFLMNVGACLLAAILLLFAEIRTFTHRWACMLMLAPIAWLTTHGSEMLWYRFPMMYSMDSLYCLVIDWVLAGAVIAAFVKPPEPGNTESGVLIAEEAEVFVAEEAD